jgi:nuclear pore complex protein Nup107
MRVDEEGGDSTEERKRALMRAREHGLDVNRVAVVAAERSVDKAFEVSCLSAHR